MGSNIGTILSFLFVINVFLFGSDLINVQLLYSNLDAVAMTAGHLIVERGGITAEVAEFVEAEANATIYCVNNCTPRFGDTYIYVVTTSYEPITMSDEPIEISIRRSVVIGYYN
ncbi:MAG: hypothetical protein WC160_00860 [Bacilli bacterium]|nr:hypothetical protein [Bacilli bacterium]MDD4303572.1 hypothetical protein [Bacilli bacterium]NLB39807.1 hypothetical protein [Erysipelotrichaceae bacterium]HOF53906.1 hypothetical protein [Bacilli bacterium]HPK67955.1 hypothetical protein [Bacilli bacterium]